MKFGKRVIAFALSAVVAFGAVTYRQPKAHAVVGSMLANMCLSTYMTATGISLVPDTATAEAIASALDSLIPDFVKDYAQEVGDFTVDAFKNTIQDGCVIRTTGQLQIAHTAAALMGRFTGWLINKFGLTDENGAPVTDPVGIVPSLTEFPALPDLSSYNNPLIWFYQNSQGQIILYTSESIDAWGNANGDFTTRASTLKYPSYLLEGNSWKKIGNGGTYSMPYANVIWANFDILLKNDSLYLAGSDYPSVADWDNPTLSAVLAPDYESAPDVDEQYALVIDTGIPYADEQSYIDSILNGVASGTLSPTYTVEQATGGDVVVPDEDEEESGILNWVKNIAQDVKALPRTIADAVASVFVPSQEYMATVPEMIVETFDNRTGFLTYPTSVLYDFANRLHGGQQDFILSWPTVREPTSKAIMLEAGQFNVSKFVRDNGSLATIYTLYEYAVGAYLTFLFLGLCSRKYNSIVGDSSGV